MKEWRDGRNDEEEERRMEIRREMEGAKLLSCAESATEGGERAEGKNDEGNQMKNAEIREQE